MKSKAAEAIRRLCCFWPTALGAPELVAHKGRRGEEGTGGLRMVAMQQMGEKGSVCKGSLKP